MLLSSFPISRLTGFGTRLGTCCLSSPGATKNEGMGLAPENVLLNLATDPQAAVHER